MKKDRENFWRDIDKETQAVRKAEKMIERRENKAFDRWVKKQEKEWRKKDKDLL